MSNAQRLINDHSAKIYCWGDLLVALGVSVAKVADNILFAQIPN